MKLTVPENIMQRTCIFFLLLAAWGTALAQDVQIIKIEDLHEKISAKGEQVQVINFWATWCAPCIKELPLFEKLNAERPDVKVSLISMDMDLDPNPEKVYRFVDRKKIQSNVYILQAANPNSWIDSIDATWSGAIPATLIVNSKTGKRTFVERALQEGELNKLIDRLKTE